MRRTFQKIDRGTALVITLAILVLVTILAVGVTDSIRLERRSTDIHGERLRASLLAQDAVDRVVAALRKTTVDPERHWISQPGQIVAGAEQDDGIPGNGDLRKILSGAKRPEDSPGPLEPRVVYLHSGAVTQPFNGPPIFDSPNLNVATFLDPGSSLITDRTSPATGSKEEMRVRWIYVRKDGTIDRDEIPALTDRTNPIVGRYAFWTDDESARINCNFAWRKDAADPRTKELPVGHPSRISLAALDGFAANPVLINLLHDFVTTDNYATLNQHYFNSPEDARQVSAEVASALSLNKFEVTHFNHDPDTTFFNEPRIVLTTQAARANGKPYLRVLADETKDPGERANLDEDKLNETLFGPGGTSNTPKSTGLIYYLSRRDWPLVDGNRSLQDKYYAGDTTRLIQLAINIIDYVRSTESERELVEQIRGIPFNGLFKGEWVKANKDIVPGGVGGAESTFKGLTRQPLITEMALLVSTTNNVRLFVEVYLPLNYGLESLDLSQLELIFQIRKDGVPDRDVSISRFPVSQLVNAAEGTLLRKGEYRILSKRVSIPSNRRPAANEKVDLRAVLNLPPPKDIRLEMVPIGDPRDMYVPRPVGIQYTVPTLLTTTAALDAAPPPPFSMQTDDPRVSGIGPDWKLKSATWGAANPVEPPVANLQPQQDTTKSWTDGAGKLTGAVPQYRETTLYMPSPKGSAGNPHGMVASVGELGFIHTGMQITSQTLPASSPPVPNSPGIPWRTIRLQPSSAPTSVVPDWVLLDLFTVPRVVPASARSLFSPRTSEVGGRINLNTRIEPFSSARTLPLAAVFQNASYDATNPAATISANLAATLAQNVIEGVPANGGKRYGFVDGYDSAGELTEVRGIADGGEASEELVRQVSNLVTSRGNVFRVYSIGQALKQTPSGTLLITAEQRRETMVERFRDSSSGQIRFGVRFTRLLTP